MANEAAYKALDAEIQRIRSLGRIGEELAPEAAKALDAEIRKDVAAGKDPSGNAWQPTKDGKRPLANAAKSVATTAIGSVVLVTLSGVEARHHLGAVKGKIKRQIIPDAKLPKPVIAALKRLSGDAFAKHMSEDK